MMNNPYKPGMPYGYPGYPMGGGAGQGYPPNVPIGGYLPPSPTGISTALPIPGSEQSYIENILRMNLGKVATVYMTFENSTQWNSKIFKGVIEAAGRDHIILSDPKTGMRYVLLMVYLDYITFDEPLNYFYPTPQPYPGGAPGGQPPQGR
jgi:spore germination protein Q